MDEKFELLKNKEIIAILDGDTNLIEYKEKNYSLPYLTGPDICRISDLFGYHQTYSTLSRWQYFEQLLNFCIKEKKISNLLKNITQKERFKTSLSGLPIQEIEYLYTEIINKFIEKINEILYFGGNSLKIIANEYKIVKIDSKVEIDSPNIKIIDREYIKSLAERALQDIENNSLDSAITKARTILEETFCYGIEEKKEEPSTSGDINKLYKQVKNLYDMHGSKEMDIRINKLLSGLENIVSSVAEMRNVGSDSHGVGSKRIDIKKYHARLFVNSAVTMAEFILSVIQNTNNVKN